MKINLGISNIKLKKRVQEGFSEGIGKKGCFPVLGSANFLYFSITN